MYSKTLIYRALIYRKPWYTAAISFPQIGLNMYNVNQQNHDLRRTPIYRKPWFTANVSFPQTLQ